PDRGDEAVQRDQVGPGRARRAGRPRERRAGQGQAAAHRGGATVSTPIRNAHVSGWGRYAPSQVLTNHDLERMVDTSDEWIGSGTGVPERPAPAAPRKTA